MGKQNHIRNEDGKLIQINKKYSQLKRKQKERIYDWFYREYRAYYVANGKHPDEDQDVQIVERVIKKIIDADIWVAGNEVEKHYRKKVKPNLRKRLNREALQEIHRHLILRILPYRFCAYKLNDFEGVDLNRPYTFAGNMGSDKTLICCSDYVPNHYRSRQDGWVCIHSTEWISSIASIQNVS